MQAEYKYVKNQRGKSPDGKNEFVLVNNYTELEKAMQKKKTPTSVSSPLKVLMFFGTGAPETDTVSQTGLIKRLTQNIRYGKNWEIRHLSSTCPIISGIILPGTYQRTANVR